MADPDTPRRPNGHAIERADEELRCHTCGKSIARGGWQLVEAVVSADGKWARGHAYARTTKQRAYESGDDDRRTEGAAPNPDLAARFHHLPCAASHQPYKLRSALAASTLAIDDRAALERAIEAALVIADPAEQDPATRARYRDFLPRLAADPGDEELQVVFGDWLQSVGDPRGELVSIQRALENATQDERLRLFEQERKLLAIHRARWVPDRFEHALVWRRGFVHRVQITDAAGLDPTSLTTGFSHPSLRLLRELAIELDSWSSVVVASCLPVPLPDTLQVLELRKAPTRNGITPHGLGAIAPLLAVGLPRLARLSLGPGADLDGLRHATLGELELHAPDAAESHCARTRDEPRSLVDRIPALTRAGLPALRRLVLRVPRGLDAVVAALARTDLLDGLDALIVDGDLSPVGVASLAGARPLRELDIRRCVGITASDVAHVAVTVIAAAPVVAAPAPARRLGAWRVRHTRRPEWGDGVVTAETETGLQVEFAAAGSKLVRNVELLEDLDT